MDVRIEIDAASDCGLVLQQAGRPAVRGVRVTNEGELTLVGLSLVVSSDVGCFHPLTLAIDAIQPQETLSVTMPEREPALDYAYLSKLSDVVRAEVRVSLVDATGTELAAASAPQTIYAPDQTLGCGRPIYYAAFVVPNSDAIARLQSAMAGFLEEETGNAAITGYLEDKRSVYAQCKAAYRAIQSLGLTYAVSPASFGQPGQKVRLPDDILKYKTGCCLDTTLLFAALFEKCGLRPVIALFDGHAVVGCHLTDESFSDPVISDAEVLEKALAEDRLVLVETTLVGGDASFAAAETSAKQTLQGGKRFVSAVDVALARGMGILPLPLASNGENGEVDGRDVDARDERLRELKMDVDLNELDDAKEKSLAEKRIENWSHRLLDLSRANRLLNVRENAKVVPVICSALPALEDGLSSDRLYSVKSYENYLDEDAAAEFRRSERPVQLDRYGATITTALQRGELWSALARRETERRLRDLYRSTRVDLEESGVNTLFLALGILEWREKEGNGQTYRAPILLLPVRIERKSVSEGFRIRRLDEDTIVNTTLLELLRRDYGLTIPGLDPLPVDESGCDVQKIFGIFRAAIRSIAGLTVHEDCLLGQFSFAKFVMWKDLTARIDAVRANPIVSHLISRDGRYDDGVEVFPREEIDRHLAYAKLCCPLSADSSQLAAVLYSERGKTFVLEGPPGTGKSQTITNIIAHNLSLGRRVLFVSEKKAALDVVYSRLAKLGLAPFCLELHSNKSGKGQVYEQFKSALAQGSKTPACGWEGAVRETETLRRELDAYVGALHRQTVSGFTAYELFTRLVRGELAEDADAVSGETRSVTREAYEAAGRELATAAEARAGISAEAVHALAAVRPFAWSPAAEQRLADEAKRLAEEIAAAVKELEDVGGEKGKDAEKVVRYLKLLKTRREFENNLSSQYDIERLRTLPVRELRRRLSEIDASFVVVRIFRTRALVNELSSVLKEGRLSPGDLREVLKQASLLQEADAEASELEKIVRPLMTTDFDAATSDPEATLLARARAELRLEKAMADFKNLADCAENVSTAEAVELAHGIAAFVKGNLRRAFIYFGARAKIPAVAQGAARQLDEDDAPNPQEWRQRFEKAFQNRLLNEILESEPVFGMFFGQNREAAMKRFAELDATCARLSLENLIAKLSSKIPVQSGSVRATAKSELGLLLHECGKKRQQKPIRQMLAEAPGVIADLKPCFLMSPLSVAQYLPVDAEPFDLIVFDEASQIPVWDAVGVIARGSRLIVVGDTKQLPPTNFFQRGADEEEACEDLESVLDECCHAGFLTCSLGWHYRSRHESLIAFSNQRYYGSGLHVFPAAEKSERLGVAFVHVPDGVYEARGSRTNRREAEVVVDRVFEILTGAATSDMSVGVVTFSEAQRELIEDLIDERRLEHPELEARFAADATEPFFVKNLENVQGDERDAIVFSIGYAPDANGKFNMIFGPLGNQGGERRLNVAITRAREKIVVVSSIHAHQIDTERTSGQGPADLKAFLDYAERGYRISLGAAKTSEDGFAAEVAAVLEKAGAKVALSVGCGGVHVDVAVRDEENPSRYLMGFVCDGASYARELTARDRDSLRDGVLKSLGWTIHHVWITDWALDRERAERELLSNYNSTRQKKEIRP